MSASSNNPQEALVESVNKLNLSESGEGKEQNVRIFSILLFLVQKNTFCKKREIVNGDHDWLAPRVSASSQPPNYIS